MKKKPPMSVKTIERHLRKILAIDYTLQFYEGEFIINVPGGLEELRFPGKTIEEAINKFYAYEGDEK